MDSVWLVLFITAHLFSYVAASTDPTFAKFDLAKNGKVTATKSHTTHCHHHQHIMDYATGQAGPAGQQGAPGNPGMPGIQGIQGVQGVQGPAGQAGQPGRQGQKGRKGDQGRKGQRGMKGSRGVKGEPGSRFQTSAGGVEDIIAFSVTIDKDMPKTSEYRTVKFNVVLTNIGEAYNSKSGIFTAPINGTYLLGFSGVSYHGQNILLHLIRNGSRMLSSYNSSGCQCCSNASPGNAKQQKCAGSSSNGGVLVLAEGDQVWIELPDEHGLHNALYHNYASFHGTLLHRL